MKRNETNLSKIMMITIIFSAKQKYKKHEGKKEKKNARPRRVIAYNKIVCLVARCFRSWLPLKSKKIQNNFFFWLKEDVCNTKQKNL